MNDFGFKGQGIDHDGLMNLNRTVFTIEKQQNLIKSNLDLITRKMDRSDDEINFLLKYVNNQGTGTNQYFAQNQYFALMSIPIFQKKYFQ